MKHEDLTKISQAVLRSPTGLYLNVVSLFFALRSKQTERAHMAGDSSNDNKPRIQSVARAAQILAVVARSRSGLSAREVSDAVDVHLPTVYHLLSTLCSEGLLRRDSAESRYVMGFGIGALASGFERHVSVPEQLFRCVRSVAAKTGEAVYGSGWEDSEIVILARQPGTQSVNAAESPLGLSVHAHARASGKLLLALAEGSQRDSYLARRPPVPLTPNTLEHDALLTQLASIAKHRFATDQEEFSLGVCCLAVPCRIGQATFALALSSPADRFNAQFDTYLRVLRDVAGTDSVQVAATVVA